jgi:hypothetical protein
MIIKNDKYGIFFSNLDLLKELFESIDIKNSIVRQLSDDRRIVLEMDLSNLFEEPLNLRFTNLKNKLEILSTFNKMNSDVEFNYDDKWYYFTSILKYKTRIPIEDLLTNKYIEQLPFDINQFNFISEIEFDVNEIEYINIIRKNFNEDTLILELGNPSKLKIETKDEKVDLNKSFNFPIKNDILIGKKINIYIEPLVLSGNKVKLTIYESKAVTTKYLLKFSFENYGTPIDMYSQVELV